MQARLILINGKVIVCTIGKNTTAADIIYRLPEYGLPLRLYELIFCGRKLDDKDIISNLEDLELNYIVVHEIEKIIPIPTFNSSTLREMIHDQMLRNISTQIQTIPSQLSSNPAILRQFQSQNRRNSANNSSSRLAASSTNGRSTTSRRSGRPSIPLPIPISNLTISQCAHAPVSIPPESENNNAYSPIDLTNDVDD